MANYVLSVGMEVHAELLTESKMFCRCQVAFGGEPNSRVCPVCLGLPGALPVPNKHAIELVMKTALALNCTIARDSVFHRKNYFYPDLPKGYQISQYGETNPIGYHGWIDIPVEGGKTKRIKIARVHLEEDTGKLMHLPGGGSGVDLNRAGVPLMEIVTAFPPDIESPEEAKEYGERLRQLLVYLGVCDGKMEEGSMRAEPNPSVRPEGSETFGVKTELKNLGSFRSVFGGVEFERNRQVAAIERGEPILQETRGWNEDTQASYVMRVKESENDYRYFPCPDLMPMFFDDAMIERIRATIGELPIAKWQRYQNEFGLSEYDAGVLTAERPWAEFFEACVAAGAEPKAACNWMNSDFARLLNETGQSVVEQKGRSLTKVTPAHIAELTGLIAMGTISGKIGKQVFGDMFESGKMPNSIVEEGGMTQVSDSGQVDAWTAEVLADNPDVVQKYHNGQTNVMGFLVGQLMKKSQGRANPQLAQEALRKALGE